jgi:hypothetical protein
MIKKTSYINSMCNLLNKQVFFMEYFNRFFTLALLSSVSLCQAMPLEDSNPNLPSNAFSIKKNDEESKTTLPSSKGENSSQEEKKELYKHINATFFKDTDVSSSEILEPIEVVDLKTCIDYGQKFWNDNASTEKKVEFFKAFKLSLSKLPSLEKYFYLFDKEVRLDRKLILLSTIELEPFKNLLDRISKLDHFKDKFSFSSKKTRFYSNHLFRFASNMKNNLEKTLPMFEYCADAYGQKWYKAFSSLSSLNPDKIDITFNDAKFFIETENLNEVRKYVLEDILRAFNKIMPETIQYMQLLTQDYEFSTRNYKKYKSGYDDLTYDYRKEKEYKQTKEMLDSKISTLVRINESVGLNKGKLETLKYIFSKDDKNPLYKMLLQTTDVFYERKDLLCYYLLDMSTEQLKVTKAFQDTCFIKKGAIVSYGDSYKGIKRVFEKIQNGKKRFKVTRWGKGIEQFSYEDK